MRIHSQVKRALLLLIGLPALAFLTLALIMPLYFRLTARPVHADAASVPARAETPSASRWTFAADESARLARTLVASANLPGLSLAVGIDGELVWAAGFGWADIEQQLPATPATQYRIGTASVPLAAAAAGVLLQRGRLDLDQPVQAYLPDFPAKPWPLSTRQAMAHTAGFGHPHIEGACHDANQGVSDGLALFADAPLRFEPGSRFRYSSYGWILVSAVVQAAAGEPFEQFLREQVLDPLHMHGTWPEQADAPGPERAQLYHPRASGDTATGLEHPDFTDYRCYAGAGAYLSTPSDLVRLAHAMDAAALFDARIVALLQAPVTLPDGSDRGYGLGWHSTQAPFGGGATTLIGHPGVTIGGTTTLRRHPELRIVVAVSTNVTFADLAPLAAQVAALFHAARGEAAANVSAPQASR